MIAGTAFAEPNDQESGTASHSRSVARRCCRWPMSKLLAISGPCARVTPLGAAVRSRSVKDVADVAYCYGPLRGGECRRIDRRPLDQKLRQRDNSGRWAPVQRDDST